MDKDRKNIMEYETVALDDENSALVIIDQTKLPGETELIHLHTGQEIWDAIYLLKVRGAPAIGVAAAFGIYLLAKQIQTQDYEVFYREFRKQKEYLNSSRPTAVNLSWALNRMEQVCIILISPITTEIIIIAPTIPKIIKTALSDEPASKFNILSLLKIIYDTYLFGFV